MNRLQKKCLMASGGLHAFLLLVLVFGAAFITKRPPDPPVRLLNVVPIDLVDAALSGGGGNPNLPRTEDRVKGEILAPQPPKAAEPAPAAPAPPPPVAAPPEPTPPEPTPPPPVPKVKSDPPPKVEPKVEAPVPKPKAPTTPVVKDIPKPVEKVKPRIDLGELVQVKRTDDKRAEKERQEAEAREAREVKKAAEIAERQRRERQATIAAEQRRRAAELTEIGRAIGGVVKGLEQGFKEGTKVEVGGPGGAAFANYKDYLYTVYNNAWVVGPELVNKEYAALIKITIARNGRVLSSRILRPSGSTTMDRSVQKAMDQVRSEGLRPFPAGVTESEQSFTIEFNLKAKSGLG